AIGAAWAGRLVPGRAGLGGGGSPRGDGLNGHLLSGVEVPADGQHVTRGHRPDQPPPLGSTAVGHPRRWPVPAGALEQLVPVLDPGPHPPQRWARIIPKLYWARTVAWGRLSVGNASTT